MEPWAALESFWSLPGTLTPPRPHVTEAEEQAQAGWGGRQARETHDEDHDDLYDTIDCEEEECDPLGLGGSLEGASQPGTPLPAHDTTRWWEVDDDNTRCGAAQGQGSTYACGSIAAATGGAEHDVGGSPLSSHGTEERPLRAMLQQSTSDTPSLQSTASGRATSFSFSVGASEGQLFLGPARLSTLAAGSTGCAAAGPEAVPVVGASEGPLFVEPVRVSTLAAGSTGCTAGGPNVVPVRGASKGQSHTVGASEGQDGEPDPRVHGPVNAGSGSEYVSSDARMPPSPGEIPDVPGGSGPGGSFDFQALQVPTIT